MYLFWKPNYFILIFLRLCWQILVDRRNWIEKSPPLVSATCLLQFQGHILHWNSRWLIESEHWHFNDMKWVYILHECQAQQNKILESQSRTHIVWPWQQEIYSMNYSYSMVRLVWCDKYQEEVIRLSTKFFAQELKLGD